MKDLKKLIQSALCVLAIILESLPFGAVLYFAKDGGSAVRRTYPYFSLIPYGYANFAPFLVALLTCVLLALCILSYKRPMQRPICILSGVATVLSLAPLFLGLRHFSVVGALISCTLCALFILSLLEVKKEA